jgi:hypothetical protein
MSLLYPTLAADARFSPASRVWIYTSDRILTDAEVSAVTRHLEAFCQQWTAHNQALRARSEVFDNQYIILMVDETMAEASGCSIDKSIHFLEALGRELNLDFFERMRFGWVNKEGNIKVASRSEFDQLIKDGMIGPSTQVLNTLASTRQELQDKWLLPFGESWHQRLF